VWGDHAYRGQRAVIRQNAPSASDFINRRYRQRGVVDEAERAKNRTKSKVRPKVEHPIVGSGSSNGCSALSGPLSRIGKGHHCLVVTCALANLFMARRHLLRSSRCNLSALVQKAMNTRIGRPLALPAKWLITKANALLMQFPYRRHNPSCLFRDSLTKATLREVAKMATIPATCVLPDIG
jgi:hypothetical protein